MMLFLSLQCERIACVLQREKRVPDTYFFYSSERLIIAWMKKDETLAFIVLIKS